MFADLDRVIEGSANPEQEFLPEVNGQGNGPGVLPRELVDSGARPSNPNCQPDNLANQDARFAEFARPQLEEENKKSKAKNHPRKSKKVKPSRRNATKENQIVQTSHEDYSQGMRHQNTCYTGPGYMAYPRMENYGVIPYGLPANMFQSVPFIQSLPAYQNNYNDNTCEFGSADTGLATPIRSTIDAMQRKNDVKLDQVILGYVYLQTEP